MILDDLRIGFEANTARNLRLAGELVAATRRLAAAGVTTASWKGPLLAERAYGDLRMRQFFDLDLLIRRSDLEVAVGVLEGLGFLSERSITPAQQGAYVDHMGELELVREADGLWVEIHTAIVPTYFARGRGTDDMWRHLRPARLARTEVLALDPVDELEALCVHGSKHRWERLAWIVDIAMLGRQLDVSEWQRLQEGASRRGTMRMVNAALALAMNICAATLPDEVAAGVRADTAARSLARMARKSLFDRQPGRSAELRFHFRMWDRASDRLRYLANIALTPSVADWEFISLPRPLSPLYLIVRPVRMASDALRKRGPGTGH